MSSQETIYKIFIASPSGLNDERKAFAKVIEEYNKSDAMPRGVSFRAVGWEDTLGGMGRPQALINEDLKECDFFILLLHNRWGSNPGKNEQSATSGTEEEFLLAMDCYKDENSHMKQIVCAFKSISSEQLADPGVQLKKIIKFKKELEKGKKLLYSSFFSEQEFQSITRKQLGKWLLNHENEAKRNQKIQADLPIVPEKTIHIETESIEGSVLNKDTEEIIKNAQKLAKDGKLTEAEIEFSKAIIYSPGNYELLSYTWFLMDIGQLDKALMMLDKLLEDQNSKNNLSKIASSSSYKGIILKTRGDLDEAEVLYEKALEINQLLGLKGATAKDYVNLGNLMVSRGKFKEAEALYNESLEINKELDNQEGMSTNYLNLGVIRGSFRDFNGAEIMFKKSLEIEIKLGRNERMADIYVNLGIVMRNQGKLKEAENITKKSLKINEQLGKKEAIANDYGNLGSIMNAQGDLNNAEVMYHKSLKINEQLGKKEGLALNYGNIGNLMKKQKKIKDAEMMYKKSLEIAKAQGSTEIIKKITKNLEILREEIKNKNS